MEKKIMKVYVDHGFGFPVRISNAPMIKVRGIWALNVNQNELTTAAALALSHEKSLLTGNQLKFIRYFFKMTLKKFGDRFGVAHSTVINWEKKGDQPTKMEWGTEKDLRMEVMHHVYKNPEKIGDLFVELSEKPRAKSAQLEIEDLRAAS